ncbi:MAG TPA: aromatic ring-hydroxylating dioxygenase subunit alpha [Beijerinckiaceae bacterium]|jgi:vanillate O-demethylase monooxygenase subunit
MFLRDHWYIGALRHTLRDEPLRRIVLGRPVVLFRTPEGEAVALEDRCIHRQAPLSMGSVQPDGTLQCLYHGIRFRPDGTCAFIPEQSRIPRDARVRSYPVVERGQWVWVWTGDPEKADPADVPAYPWFMKDGWKARTGQLHVRCNYKLIVDNLLNMAHLPYVHPRTIGSDGVIKDAKVSVTREGYNVRLARRMYDIEPPPTYKQAGGFTGNVNRWQTIDFVAPSSFEFHTGVIEVGHKPPGPELDRPKTNARILDRHAMHSMTPETESSTHYFVGFSYDPEDISEDMADFIFDQTFRTFQEDVVILEAQQVNMELTPGEKTLDIVSDAAGNQALRALAELEKAQAAH